VQVESERGAACGSSSHNNFLSALSLLCAVLVFVVAAVGRPSDTVSYIFLYFILCGEANELALSITDSLPMKVARESYCQCRRWPASLFAMPSMDHSANHHCEFQLHFFECVRMFGRDQKKERPS